MSGEAIRTLRSALVVEDEAVLLMLVAETLRDAGFTVFEAPDGRHALDTLRAHSEIALMITDIKMPGMNGYQLADEALKLRQNLKILIMTGYSEEAMPKHIAERGIPLLHKPFDVDRLPVVANNLLK
jgi:CheY-like chemotaxis protein